jgi:anti-sigma regulatory factor (Ser/Thr protein kinase)
VHLGHVLLLRHVDTICKSKSLVVTRWRLLDETTCLLSRPLRPTPFTMTQQHEKIDLTLTPEPGAPSTARHALNRLAGFLPPTKLEDLRLVVNELVTNSILHAGLSPNDKIRVVVTAKGGSVRGKVEDPGSGFDVPSNPGPRPDFSGGWGLPIVDRISDRWGAERDGMMRVWFELD